ncbi:hypothetical protein [Cohnella soli]|uniref:Uncharacterized protein n=1 Tax=Cohnella soli TaxID=425005 RepID=A0ABW0HP01_9BACL
MDILLGHFTKTAKGRNSFEIWKGEADLILKIAFLLRDFGFTSGPLMSGLDGHYMDLVSNNIKLNLGWDIWSGLFLSAVNEEGDIWVNKLGEEINRKLRESFF